MVTLESLFYSGKAAVVFIYYKFYKIIQLYK